MNAIEDNMFTRGWQDIAKRLPHPEAILAVSAHWLAEGTYTSDRTHPRMIYDMNGFPQPLYEVRYAAPGSPELARRLMSLCPGAAIDNTWGIDHGAWSVLVHMFPEADVPVVQLSLDARLDAAPHFALGRALAPLRDEGVLIFCSGNVVHNLRLVDWNMADGYAWADAFDAYIRQCIEKRDYTGVIDHRRAGVSAEKAFPTPEHFWPLLYALGAADADDKLTVFDDARVMGALSMTSYIFE
jgi:4,5-DOPA dioxygenase extradiol